MRSQAETVAVADAMVTRSGGERKGTQNITTLR